MNNTTCKGAIHPLMYVVACFIISFSMVADFSLHLPVYYILWLNALNETSLEDDEIRVKLITNTCIHLHPDYMEYIVKQSFVYSVRQESLVLGVSLRCDIKFLILQRLKDLWRCFQTSIIIDNNVKWQQRLGHKALLHHKVIIRRRSVTIHHEGDETHC